MFGLLAYENPQESPIAAVLDPAARAKLADAINSAILGMWLRSAPSCWKVWSLGSHSRLWCVALYPFPAT